LKSVLITRPQPGADQTAARIAALGLCPVVAPVLVIAGRQVHPPIRLAATVLSSQNAVQACPPSIYDRPVFAVGAATAAQATRAGFSHVLNADGDSTALASLIASTISPTDGTLFLPTAQGQGGTLATSLRQFGFRVFRRVAYQAVGVSTLPQEAVEALRLGQVAAAMFFSGETARHFVHLLRTAGLVETVRNVEAVAISERAAMALRPLPWRRISVAAKPNQDAMLVLLQ
jgi:uroporphyrinogen-III synthase